ncbi:polyphosphate polymerase domain-containing protein [Streptomyces sp. HPF1205]|uniref:polyphosphate polymerase domain-containing protein n=1 Tax=Streptomyces sp. HPF1205 TaxID=2873262 RepID=UPI001CEC395F|nr:polyphosphate polymerase domain-containing protein [Streptomyces sp. HPF1205]
MTPATLRGAAPDMTAGLLGADLLGADLLGADLLEGATLAEVDRAAALQHRTDRKYLLPVAAAARLVSQLAPTHRVLDLDGRRSTSYRSVYFDTRGLAAWRGHAQRRRKRWKVRTRLYVEDGLCRTEVKTKDGRGATVKHSLTVPGTAHGTLDREQARFIGGILAREAIAHRADALVPTADVRYRRIALADLTAGTRVTLDSELTFHRENLTASLAPGWVLVETKGTPRPAPADRLLHRLGAREVSVSKYVTALALLVPGLPDNDVRRLARTHFTRSAPAAGATITEPTR